MATVTSLGFNIFSTYSGRGVNAARRDLRRLSNMIIRIDRLNEAVSGLALSAVRGMAVATAPALITLGQGALYAGGAFLAMGVQAGAAGGIFGTAMVFAAKRAFQLRDAGQALTASQGAFITSTKMLTQTWNQFLDRFSPQLLNPMTTAIFAVRRGIGLLPPVIMAVAPVAQRVANAFARWVSAENGFRRFVDVIVRYGVPSLNHLANAGRHVLAFLGAGFRAFAPEGLKMAQLLERGALALRRWAEAGGFQRFIATVKSNGPAIGAFFRALGDALRQVGTALGGMAPVALRLATALLRVIASMPIPVIQGLIYAYAFWKTATVALIVAKLLLGNTLATLALRIIAAKVALVAHAIATHAVTIATRAAAAAQWLWNAALLANPIGLIVLAVIALVAAIVWLATKTTFFQYIWNAVWTTNKAAFQFFVNSIIIIWNFFVNLFKVSLMIFTTVVRFLWTNLWNGMRFVAVAIWAGIRFAWNTTLFLMRFALNVASVVMRTVWRFMWNAMRVIANAIWAGIRFGWTFTLMLLRVSLNIASAVMRTVWRFMWSAMRVIANAIWAGIRAGWNATLNIMRSILNAASGAIRAIWRFMWNNLRAVGNAVMGAIRSGITTGLNAIRRGFTIAVNGIRTAWNRLREATAAPVRFFVNTVYGGMRKAWNGTAGKIPGVPDLPAARVGFARGGPIRGTGGPTADNIPIMASSGEYMIRAAVVKKFGTGFFDQINRGGMPGNKFKNTNPFEGLFLGGLIPSPSDLLKSAAKAVGGIWSQIGQFAGLPGMGNMFDWGGDFLDKKIVKKALEAMFKPIMNMVNGMMGKFPKGGMVTKLPIQLMKQAVPKMIDFVVSKVPDISSFMFGAGGTGGAAKWTPFVLAALKMAGESASHLGNVLRAIMKESGGNARAVNNWDSNAKKGTPSGGLLQTIGPTFNAYAGALRGLGMFNPLANIYAAIRYARARYGGGWSARMAAPGGYAMGGLVNSFDQGGLLPTGLSLAYNGTGKPEPVGHNLGGGQVVFDFRGAVFSGGRKEFEDMVLKALSEAERKGRLKAGVRR